MTPPTVTAAKRRVRAGTGTAEDVATILRHRNTAEDRFALHAMATIAARVARTGCEFGCAERAAGPSPYCSTHAPR